MVQNGTRYIRTGSDAYLVTDPCRVLKAQRIRTCYQPFRCVHLIATWRLLLLLQRAAAGCSGSSNFLIYEIEAAAEAAPAIFGRYLVTQRRQLLWPPMRFGRNIGYNLSSPAPIQYRRRIIISCADTWIRAQPSSPFRRQLRRLNFQLGKYTIEGIRWLVQWTVWSELNMH